MPNYTVTCPLDYLNVRAQANNLAAILGCLKKGSKITGEVDEGGKYLRIELKGGNSVLYTTAYNGVELYGFVWLQFLTKEGTVTPPPPPPPPNNKLPLIGVNVLNNGPAADKAIAEGCRYIHMTFNTDYAWVLKQRFPNLMVSVRGLFHKGYLPTDHDINQTLNNGFHPGMKIVTPCNENDQIGCDTPALIKQRADYDARLWKRCKDSGAQYYGGGFAMGNPNIMIPDLRKAMRDYYAPLFNAGMGFNQHNYCGNDHSGIPIKQEIFTTQPWDYVLDGVKVSFRQTWWLLERIRFYEAFCGFNSSLPTSGSYLSDEGGVDNPGPFSDFGYTADEVGDYAKQEQILLSQPTVINGVARPIRYEGTAYFQVGDTNGSWKHFNLEQYYGGLQRKGVWIK